MGERGSRIPRIGHGDVRHDNCRGTLDGLSGLCRGGETGLHLKHPRHTLPRREGAGHGDDIVRHLDKFDQDLRHIVIERDDLPLCEIPVVDADSTTPDEGDDTDIDDDIGERVRQGGEQPDVFL